MQKKTKDGDELYQFFDAQTERYRQIENERTEIKRIGFIAGACVIGYVIMQYLLSFVLVATPVYKVYAVDPTMQSVVSIFFSVFGLLVPFAIGGYFISKKSGAPIVKFDNPVSIPLMLGAVPLGFFVCLVGNYITGLFVTFMDYVGITLTSPEYNVPEDLAGRIVYTVSIAVVPALVEEFAIRGVILQPLRKYGDRFAIVASAFIFAVLHGNLIQAPFALIAGIGIGYAVCITNSIWTGVLIHFVNNLYSVAVEFMTTDITDIDALNGIYNIVIITLYVISILGSVLFVLVKDKRKLVPSFTTIPEGQKARAFVLSIPMIIALILMLVITKDYVAFK